MKKPPVPQQELADSQFRLIWRRFWRRGFNRFGFVLLAIFLLVFLPLADFLSPYNPGVLHTNYIYMAPMALGKIHSGLAGGFPWFSVYVKKQERVDVKVGDRVLPGVYNYLDKPDESARCPIYLFARGDEYRFWGLFPTDLHLFGTGAKEGQSDCHIFILGTDGLGRDLLSRTLYGGRISLGIVLLVLIPTLWLGGFLGALSGYYRGSVDILIQRLIELLMSMPRLVILLTLAVTLSLFRLTPAAHFGGIVVVLIGLSWAPVAKVVRGLALVIREEEFILAARSVGCSNLRIILRHVLPNTTSYLIISAVTTIPSVLILESTISFLGYGIGEPWVSWGTLLQDAYSPLHIEFHPWLLIPAMFVFLTVWIFDKLGHALRDAMDPFVGGMAHS